MSGPVVSGLGARLAAEPTTLVLLRHGVTDHTVRRLFCGSGGSDPDLNEEGRAQAARAAAWISRHHQVDAVIASPLRRAQQTAEAVAQATGLDIATEPGVAEAAFGEWDGHSFGEVMERWPEEMAAWFESPAVAPPGGESLEQVDARVQAALERILDEHRGRTVVVVSHVTPIKMLVKEALGAPITSIHALELAPASVSTLAWWPDGLPSLRGFSLVPE
ncbi:MAG: histidine phosphatase family protein [Aeromicrobium sp.]|uniref:histidine phosphatase family protein n=1 Tax=Aeromicrobium sp. TaxID=1871063 RepID=UPI0039E35E1F